MEKEFTAPTLEEARDRADQWLTQQEGIRLVRQKQESGFGSGGQDVQWTVTLTYEADGIPVIPEASADSDDGVGTA